MDQGVIKNLKVQYGKQILTQKFRVEDNDEELKVNILQALLMMKRAWESVTATTIQNCFKHAGFRKEEETIDDDDKEYHEVPDDPDDDIPLARLAEIFGSTATMEDYLSIDSNLPATEDTADDHILQDLRDMVTRVGDAASSDEEETTSNPPPKTFAKSAMGAINVIRKYLEECKNSHHLQSQLDGIERFVS
ncbi:hypothetical protein DPMN_046721 [Dreissena polymorpha]|uniref:DDE-1 domain-containing protein n=1 Tax=Dreissena polymorpha TaxID=45954 RepID=A0A9D4D6F5_DREPO|nr:hypothetical protein DPMN_046721 [Dreissena polymorpha]